MASQQDRQRTCFSFASRDDVIVVLLQYMNT